jgi:hypothetical protein
MNQSNSFSVPLECKTKSETSLALTFPSSAHFHFLSPQKQFLDFNMFFVLLFFIVVKVELVRLHGTMYRTFYINVSKSYKPDRFIVFLATGSCL